MSEEIHDHLSRLFEETAQIKGRLERMFRPGMIIDNTDVDVSDPTKPRARICTGLKADGTPKKGPWVPFATIAGARNQHSAPSKGQQFMHISPDGDPEQGFLVPLGHSDQFPSPSTDPKDFVDGTGKTDKRFKDGKDRTAVGDKSEHLIVDKAQRITIEKREKFVIKFAQDETTWILAASALEPAEDIENY